MGGQRASERLDDKVRSYELFLNDVLKEDLKKSKQLKAKLQAELQEFEELEANLRLVQEQGLKEMKLQVDIGAEVLCQAHVPDTSRVFISIGLGFHVECALDEAPRVIGVRKEALRARIGAAEEQDAKIAAHIRLVEGALAELQRLGAPVQPRPAERW